MILPGISGAFILLLLGKYQYILQAVSEFRLGVLLLFAVGAVAGIISFSHLLSWLLRKHHDLTISLLMGFMVGSLNKVWPWKEVRMPRVPFTRWWNKTLHRDISRRSVRPMPTCGRP